MHAPCERSVYHRDRTNAEPGAARTGRPCPATNERCPARVRHGVARVRSGIGRGALDSSVPMLVQADYETEATFAVLQSPATTEAAIQRLHRIGIPDDAIQRAQVPPDTYQILDTSADDALDAIVRGASIGVP